MNREINQQINQSLNMLTSFFKDKDISLKWMNTPNLSLGNKTPRERIIAGDGEKIMRWIENKISAKAENT